MSVCASGASQAKSGQAASMVIDQQYIQNLLPTALSWAYPYLDFMHGLEIGNVGTFCAADPPTWTVPSGADVFAFVTGGPLSQYAAVNDFLQNITKYYLWRNICECTSGALPTAVTPPSAPSNLPAVNPPGTAVLPNPLRCMEAHTGPSVMGSAGTKNDMYYGFLGGAQQSITFHHANTPAGATHPTVTFRLEWISGESPNVTPIIKVEPTYTLATGASRDDTFIIPVGAKGFISYLIVPVGGSTDQLTTSFEIWCGPAPVTPIAAPCPPDPFVRQILKQILDLVTLIQRQQVPFAYIGSTSHTALVDDGNFSVQGLIGLSVDVTTLPSSYGVSAGTPVELFDIGFLSVGTPDGWVESVRITHDGFVWLPPLMGAFTLVGYTLRPGVVATIKELVREP